MKIPTPDRGIRLPDLDKDGFSLDDGEARHREYPDTFEIPDLSVRQRLAPGDFVKLMFEIDVDGDIEVERMWVIVRERTGSGYRGVLDNDASAAEGNPRLLSGAELVFEPKHVIATMSGNEASRAAASAPVAVPWED